jgi:hypothetical protein
MAGTKRKAPRSGTNRTHLSKSALLPMPARPARELSLAHYLALATCRSDSGNRHQINELVRSVYMAYYLQRMGFGDVPFECYEHAEATLAKTLAVAERSAKWVIDEEDALVIERLLALGGFNRWMQHTSMGHGKSSPWVVCFPWVSCLQLRGAASYPPRPAGRLSRPRRWPRWITRMAMPYLSLDSFI